jgi:hypothetical protein
MWQIAQKLHGKNVQSAKRNEIPLASPAGERPK